MLTLLALLACAPTPDPSPVPSPDAAAAEAPPERPRLAVYLVVDQLPVGLFERAQPLFTGGFQTLTAEPAWSGTARYSHAVAFTCPGHATLSTGAAPNVHGIIGNDWVEAGESKYCADIANLRADTLADRVHAGGGKVASFSLKDRAALMLGGRSPDAIAWYEKKTGLWCDRAPAWLPTDPIAAVLQSSWEAQKPEVYATFFPDDGEFEEVIEPIGRTFPHPPAGLDKPGLFRLHPGSGTVLTDIAIQALDQLELGRDETPDLLAVSYSQTDYIGHAFTPESWESVDALVVLDADLKRLFAALDEKVGEGRYVVALTSDHGAASSSAKRLAAVPLGEKAEAAMHAAGLAGELRFSDNHLYLPATPDAELRAAAARAVASALTDVDGILGAWAWRADGLPDGIPQREAVLQSLDEQRAGDVYVLLAENTLLDFDGLNRGTSHGTPWEHDTVVPLQLFGSGVAAAKGQQVDVRAIAPTLAALIGVDAPTEAQLPPIPSAVR